MDTSSILPILIIYGAIGILTIASLWKLFTIANEPGWAVLVPIYSTLVMLKIGGKPWHWFLLMCIPLVGLYWAIAGLNAFVKSFGYSSGYTVGVMFLPMIFLPMKAISKI
jgi:hypothetical protein